jgi:hypothetical protein
MAIPEMIVIEAKNNARAAFEQLSNDAKKATNSMSEMTNNVNKGSGSAKTSITSLSSSLTDSISNFAKFSIAGVAVGEVLSEVSQYMREAVTAAGEAQMIGAQLDAVLKSTGYEAGLTSDKINSYSDELMRSLKIDDEVITKAQALMLTFTQVKSEIFDEAIMAAINMTAVLNQGQVTMGGLQNTIMQLGKTLTDPALGMTTLRRQGVIFTEAQEDMIKALADSGDLLGAQRYLLAELEKKFGGAAAAIGDTYVGAVNNATNANEELAESFGNRLLPVLTYAKNDMADLKFALADWINNLELPSYMPTVQSTSKILACTSEIDEVTDEINKKITNGTIKLNTYNNEWMNNLNIVTSVSGMMAVIPKISATAMAAGLGAGISGAGKKAYDDYIETIEDLKKEEAELTAELEKSLKLGWSPISNKVIDLNNSLEINATKQRQATAAISETTRALIYEQAAAGLDIETSLDLSRAMGLLSEQDYARAVVIQQLREAFDDNNDSQISAAEGAKSYAVAVGEIDDAIELLNKEGTPITLESLSSKILDIEEGTKATIWSTLMEGSEEAETNTREFFDKLIGSASEARTTVRGILTELNALENKSITVTITTIYKTIYSSSGVAGAGPGSTQYTPAPYGGAPPATPRAGGGAVIGGQPYWWNEAGQGEVLIPAGNGYILNREQAEQALAKSGNGGGQTVNNNYYFDVSNAKTAALAAAIISKEHRDKFNKLMGD